MNWKGKGGECMHGVVEGEDGVVVRGRSSTSGCHRHNCREREDDSRLGGGVRQHSCEHEEYFGG